MNQRSSHTKFVTRFCRDVIAVLCMALLLTGDPVLIAKTTHQQPEEQAAKIPDDQLDSLVAPIALYPDPLLAQLLAASTYPLEIIQLQQFLAQHKDLKDQALVDAVKKEGWDPTVQALAPLPDVVKRLADDIKWTTDLGNAVLAQESDVMNAVQRMRAKAQEKGNLKSSEQIKVETKVVESKQVIVVEQADPKVVYVPSYDPVVVYGPPVYPYPPIAYPPPGYYAAGMALSFGIGVAMGAAWGGGWCCNSGWGGNNNININNNNTFVNNSNRQNVSNRSNQSARGGGSQGWKHNAQHRGGAPYANRTTADRFGGTTRGSSQAARQNSARQNVGRQQAAGRQFGDSSRGGLGSGQGGSRGGDGGLGGGRGGAGAGGGANRIGDRSVSQGGGSRGTGAGGLGGSGRSSSGSGARASSSRGASSTGSRGGGGRGGGGRRR